MHRHDLAHPSIGQIIKQRLVGIDWWISLGIILLMGVSLMTLNSVAVQEGTVHRQVVRFLVGWVLFGLIILLPAQKIKKLTPLFYCLTLVILALVMVIGRRAGGAQRWLDVGGIRIQPSELAKLTVPMMIAWYSTRRCRIPNLMTVFIGLLFVALPVGLILIEPDLGTALLVFVVGFIALFLAGIPWWITGASVLSSLGAMSIYWLFFIKDYQKQRVLTLLNPDLDPTGAGYHIIQSKIAIGSGGIFGKGYQLGTQSQLDFIPESTTDFIFSVIAEEQGLVGVILLLICYSLIIFRGLYLSMQLKDRFAQVVCASIFLMFFINVFVNIGMVSGIFPVVGLPLAFISYGGSSILALMTAFALALNLINVYRARLEQTQL